MPSEGYILNHSISQTFSRSFGDGLDENIENSQDIFTGKIQTVYSCISDQGHPYMLIDVLVEESLLGSLKSGDKVTVLSSGSQLPLRAFIEANDVAYLYEGLSDDEIDSIILDIPSYHRFSKEPGTVCLFYTAVWTRGHYPNGSYDAFMICEKTQGGTFHLQTSDTDREDSIGEIVNAIQRTKKDR